MDHPLSESTSSTGGGVLVDWSPSPVGSDGRGCQNCVNCLVMLENTLWTCQQLSSSPVASASPLLSLWIKAHEPRTIP